MQDVRETRVREGPLQVVTLQIRWSRAPRAGARSRNRTSTSSRRSASCLQYVAFDSRPRAAPAAGRCKGCSPECTPSTCRSANANETLRSSGVPTGMESGMESISTPRHWHQNASNARWSGSCRNWPSQLEAAGLAELVRREEVEAETRRERRGSCVPHRSRSTLDDTGQMVRLDQVPKRKLRTRTSILKSI